MAMNFEADETVADGVRRMATELLDYAIDRMRTLDKPDKCVHETRKSLKKLRGLIRLVRPGLGDFVYQRENAFYRDTGKRLSPMRESVVRIKTLGAMGKRYGDELAGVDLRALRRQLKRSHRDLVAAFMADRAQQAEIVDQLDAARAAVARWPLPADPDLPLTGLHRSYRQGRRELAACQREPTTEALHDWRKRVKYLWYHVQMIQPCWPPVLAGLANALDDLGEILGDDHDLADFAAELTAGTLSIGGKRLDGLLSHIEQDRAALRADAFALGERVYAEKPGAFVERIDTYWRHWRRAAA